ncbi:MAG: hypothetical protein CL608_34330 [Anaerolineaceae bacterium]|jgi:hypothetical protein|nr:hypothetical protein [Anaerolineaceae bacterium]
MKLATLTTPKGTARYPHLNEPDNKFDSQRAKGGEFHVDLVIAEEDALPLIERLENTLKEFIKVKNAEQKEMKKKPFKPFQTPWSQEEDDEGTPTGNYIFKFKRGAEWTDRDGNVRTNKIEFFDSQNQKKGKLDEVIGAGSELKVHFMVRGWASPLGISCALDLLKVQIINLKTYDGGDDSNPFDVEEGGHSFGDDAEADTPFEAEEVSDTATSADF